MGWENIRVTVKCSKETEDERYQRELREREEAVRSQEKRWAEEREREYREDTQYSGDYRFRWKTYYDPEKDRFGI